MLSQALHAHVWVSQSNKSWYNFGCMCKRVLTLQRLHTQIVGGAGILNNHTVLTGGLLLRVNLKLSTGKAV